MDYQSFKQAVIAEAAAMGLNDYELYYQCGEDTSVGAYQHEINEFSSSISGGVCFRCIVNGKMGYASTEALNEAEAKAIVRRAADNAAILEAKEEVFLCEGGLEYAPLSREGYDLPATEALIRTVLDTQEKLYTSSPAVIDGCQTQGIAKRSSIAIYNSRGLDLTYENTLTGLVVASVVMGEGEMANDYQIKLGKLDTIDTDALTKKATEVALGKLGGEVAPTGQYPVIFNSEAMSDLLATFSGIFSSENAQKGLSRLVEGELVASEAVTLVDDPFHPENPSPRNFDAEGCPTRCKNVIEKGRLNTLLYNLKTAAVAGKKTTGNASKAGYDAPVAIQPFSMYLAGGEYTPDELLKKAENGVYISSLEGLHAGADPVSGDFSLQSAGYMIENGEKTTAVKSFTVAGNFYDVLKNITAAANNSHLPMPMGRTAFGSPDVLVEGLSIAGK